MRHWAVALILILSSLCPLGINTLTDRNLQLEKSGSDLVALAGSSAGLSLDHVLLTSFSSDTYPSIINPFAFASSAVSGTVTFSRTNLAIGLVSSRSVDLINIDNNYWGGTSNGNYGDMIHGTSGTLTVSETDPGQSALLTGETSWSGNISCDGGLTVEAAGSQPLVVSHTLLYDTCSKLAAWIGIKPSSPQEAKQQYDSLRLYVEQCANKVKNVWRAFLFLGGAVAQMSMDSARYDRYREWLISVLYLNTADPEYFCVCMGSISGTYQYGKYYPLGYLAVYAWVRAHHRECWGSVDSAKYAEDSAYDVSIGYDPSHLPSLDSLGLGFLLTESAIPAFGASTGAYLASFTGSPNPFVKETDLTFTLNRMSYTTIAIYDPLGRMVWGDGKGRSLDAGSHTIRIDGASLPSGTLYARISTGFGEVKTVKLVKNE